MQKNAKKLFFMLKILVVISALVIVSLTPIISALGKNKQIQNNQYSYNLMKSGFSGLDFQINFGEFTTSEIDGDDETYDRIIMQNFGFTSDFGKAELPHISYSFAVPQEATVTLDYSLSDPIIYENYNVYPAQPPKPDTGGFEDPPFTKNETFYSKNEFYPRSIVEITSEAIIRGCKINRISIYPFVYNPVTNKLKKYNSVDVRIEFNGGTDEFIPERLRSIHFQPIFDAFLLNSKDLERVSLNNPVKNMGIGSGDRADFLIVVYDDFYEEILPLAEWRHSTGLETKVVKLSEIGSSASDIRNYMTDAYNNWELPPSYLLIVGDADHVPVNYMYSHPYHGTYTGTDHWYVAVDGSDYLPEMHSGRISIEDEDQCTVVVNKVLDYCKDPYMGENWFDDVLLAAYEEYGRYFVYTSERIYNFLNPLGYNCNRQYQGTSPPGSTQGVIDAIDNGVIIANHRDHGASQNDGYGYTGWSYPNFDTNHILNDIDNGEMYPIMYSLNCDSGWFDGETDSNSGNYESIGEIGIRVENKGFAAVIASSRVSYSGYNDELCVGFYDAMWSDFDPSYPGGGSTNPYTTEVHRISQVLNYGKFWLYDKYILPGGCSPYPWSPSESSSRTTFEMFHVHGDPTMEVWTAMPQALDVTCTIETNSIEVTVESNGNPVENALVCIHQDNGIYAKGLTDSSGFVTLDKTGCSDEIATLVVTAHNYLYHEEQFVFNSAPLQPTLPQGIDEGKTATEYTFTTNSTDPEGENLYYWFDWGDGSSGVWEGPFNSGETASVSHTWSERGYFTVKVKAKDEGGVESLWSEEAKVSISNTAPIKPTIRGKSFWVIPGKEYEYTFKATDSDSDDIYLTIMWAIGSQSETHGPIASGEKLVLTHIFSQPTSTYTIRAKAQDTFGEESDWATHIVLTPKNTDIFQQILEIILERFPILIHIIHEIFY